MSNNIVPAAATGLPSRRLVLAAGSAAAVFSGLHEAIASNADAELIGEGNAVYAALLEWIALPVDGPDALFDRFGDRTTQGAERLCQMKAITIGGVKAKAHALLVHLDTNFDCTAISPEAALHERLAWSLVQDLLALNA